MQSYVRQSRLSLWGSIGEFSGLMMDKTRRLNATEIRKMKSTRIISLLIFFVIILLFNQNALTNKDDDFPIHISIYPISDSLLSQTYVNISILDSLNNIILKYPMTFEELKKRYYRKVMINKWNRDSKKLFINVTFNNSEKLKDTAKFSQGIPINGKEKSITIKFDFDSKDGIIFLERFLATKIYEGSKYVIFQRDWIPSINGKPEYKIINNLTKPIYGTSFANYFWGSVYVKIKDYWIPYYRGGLCFTVAVYEPIQPADTGYSFEGFFVGGSESFINGEYLYKDYYSFSPIFLGTSTESIIVNNTTVTINNYYELVDEFSIDD